MTSVRKRTQLRFDGRPGKACVRWQTEVICRRVQSGRMDLYSPRTRQLHQSGVEQRPRRTPMNMFRMARDSGMALLAMLLAVTFATLVAG